VPASISPRASEIFQEGLRLPPKKLFVGGAVNRDILDVIMANCRIPEQNWGDLQALVAGLVTGERRIHALIQRFGIDVVEKGMDDLIDYTARKVEAQIRRMPRGRYEFTDYIEDDVVTDIPIRLKVAMTVGDGNIHLDFTGSDVQVGSALNVPTGGRAHPFMAIALFNYFITKDPGIPLNAGVLRPIRMTLPVGSVVNPQFPAACGVRYATVLRIYDAVLGALARALPAEIPAASGGQGCMVALALPDLEAGRRHVTVIEPMIGGGGARPGKDGIDGCDASLGFLKTTPAETLESEVPAIVVRRFHLVADSAGPGRWRGGHAVRLDLQVLRPEGQITARGMERLRFQPWGVAGGKAGATGRVVLNPGTPQERAVPKIDLLALAPGDVLSIRTPGGGGHGDPLERPAEQVLADVNAGLVTPAHARDAYGVVVTAARSTRRRPRRCARAAGRARRRRARSTSARRATPTSAAGRPIFKIRSCAAHGAAAAVPRLRPPRALPAGDGAGRAPAGHGRRPRAALAGAGRGVRAARSTGRLVVAGIRSALGSQGVARMKQFRDRVAVVTGAASGIGLALAERFAAEGMKVVMADIELDALAKAADAVRQKAPAVLATRVDVSRPDDVERLARETYDAFGAAHVLCNNAGVAVIGAVHEHTLADWQWVINVNLWGVIHGVRTFLPRMLAGGDEGHIVNTASMAGLTTAQFMSVYDVTKHGVVALSESMFKEFAVTGVPIGVSVVCPGLINTKIMRSSRNRPEELADEGKAGAMAQAFGETCRTGSAAATRPPRWPSRCSRGSATGASTSCPPSPRSRGTSRSAPGPARAQESVAAAGVKHRSLEHLECGCKAFGALSTRPLVSASRPGGGGPAG
jgi:N-methylhydantoinase B